MKRETDKETALSIYLYWDGRCFRPRTEFDQELSERFARGSFLEARITEQHRPGHMRLMRLYWAVLRALVKATGRWMNTDVLHDTLKLQLGLVREIVMFNGDVRVIPRSVAASEMPGSEFKQYFDASMEFITTEIVPGTSVDEILDKGRAMLKERTEQNVA